MMKNCSCCIIQTSQATLTFSIWRCDQFDLDLLTADECKSEFRFYKKDVYLLTEVLQVPDQIRCYNRVVVDGIEALCIFLRDLHILVNILICCLDLQDQFCNFV